MRGPMLASRTLLLILLAIFLMVIDHRTSYFVKFRSVLSTLVSPLQYAVNWPVEVIDWIDSSFTTQQTLLEENASLRAKQLLIKARLQKLISLEKENKQLKALLDSFSQIQQDKVLVARVLAADSEPFMHQIIVSNGSRQGVYIGQPVLDASGVMGQVVSVSADTSRIMLLNDSLSAIPVEVVRNGLRGIAVGGGMNRLLLTHIPATTDIQVGDKLVTSGLGLRYPRGYPVGIVTSVVHKASQPFMDINVQPSAALERSRLVLLIWPSQQQLKQSVRKELIKMRQQSTKIKKIMQGRVE